MLSLPLDLNTSDRSPARMPSELFPLALSPLTCSKYDTRLNATLDILSLDLDIDISQVNSAELPRSLLESPSTPLEWNDFTLEDDMLFMHRRRHHGQRRRRGRGDRKESSTLIPSSAERASDREETLEKVEETVPQDRSKRSVNEPREEENTSTGRDFQTGARFSSPPSSSFASISSRNAAYKDTDGGISDFERVLSPKIGQGAEIISMSIEETGIHDFYVNGPCAYSPPTSDALHFHSKSNEAAVPAAAATITPTTADFHSSSSNSNIIPGSNSTQILELKRGRESFEKLTRLNEMSADKGSSPATNSSDTASLPDNDTTENHVVRRSKRWASNSRRRDHLSRTRSRRYQPLRASIRKRRIRVRPMRMRMPVVQAVVRRRRPSRVEAKVGVLVVVDNSIYRQYLKDNQYSRRTALAKIKRYYGMVFAMMDQRFGTIDSPSLSISVRISGIMVAETREDAGWLEHIVDWSTVSTHGRASIYTSKALQLFSGWVSKRKGLPKFDHAMVFTGYRLSSEKGVGLGGMAYLKAICDTESGNAVSIVGDRGDFQNVKVATHELAHSLGAYHDGYPKAAACPPEQNYIMTPVGTHKHQVLKNAFYFSRCSIRDMYIHLSKPRSACVLDEPQVYHKYDLERYPPGHLYTADQQCKLIFGKKSHFCDVYQKPDNLENIMCGLLWCKDPDKDNSCRTNSYLSALPGTRCGSNKVCHLGQCIPDPKKRTETSRRSSTHYHKSRPETRAAPSLSVPRPTRVPTLRGRSNSLPGITQKPVRPSSRMRGPRKRDPLTERRRRLRNRSRTGRRRRTRRRRRHRSRPERPRSRSNPQRPDTPRSRPDSRDREGDRSRSRSNYRRPGDPRSTSDRYNPGRPGLSSGQQTPDNPRSRTNRYRPEPRPRKTKDHYRPESPRSRSDQERSRTSYERSDRPRSRSDHYRPERPRSRSNPSTPERPRLRSGPSRPDDPRSRSGMYRPERRRPASDHHHTERPRSRLDHYRPVRPQCVADKNPRYCQGLIRLNPGGCRRQAIREYCCVTCHYQRARRRRRRR
ncbi:hypothetical protein RRG08_014428 [Elysia crispata]|uniref:Peptidase M12B domain-containing protein n=1 Tax=Elysia crispata TaxID=231223 RepID=A0AAE0YX70_9GAST|nr:hypothetical protein RRG08_014428 [Elysia crispata]